MTWFLCWIYMYFTLAEYEYDVITIYEITRETTQWITILYTVLWILMFIYILSVLIYMQKRNPVCLFDSISRGVGTGQCPLYIVCLPYDTCIVVSEHIQGNPEVSTEAGWADGESGSNIYTSISKWTGYTKDTSSMCSGFCKCKLVHWSKRCLEWRISMKV